MRRLVFFAAFGAALLLSVCLVKVLPPQNVAAAQETKVSAAIQNAQTAKAQAVDGQLKKVSFENVGFTFDTSLFSDAKGERVAAQPLGSPTDKPDGAYPEHINFIFNNTYLGEPVSGEDICSKIQIHVYSIEKEAPPISADNLYVKYADADVKELNKFLSKRSLASVSTRTQMPFVGFIDASQAFYARAKKIDFQGGTGLLFLTQWQQDASVINNDGLQYIFQGLTADKKRLVHLNFAVKAEGLQADSSADFPAKYKKLNQYGKSEKPVQIKAMESLYNKYINETAVNLDKMPAEKFTPDLTKIEDLIRSLEVK